MISFSNILIFQPAAIGDVMLATPVAKTLKHNHPGAKIRFWGHSSLRPILMELCPYIDDYIDYERQDGLISMLKTFWAVGSDLFVDLSNSKRGMFMAALAPGNIRITAYKKYPGKAPVHAVTNFLETIETICDEIPQPIFPTLFPEAIAAQLKNQLLANQNDKLLIGLVPGVGKLRPHRTWIPDGWRYLLSAIKDKENLLPVLLGGSDEIEICERLAAEHECLNLAGKLELTQTAAILKLCKVVISADTGPAHMAVAVGTPVIGLYGPTYPKRSGPYGFDHLIVDQSPSCQCHGFKSCAFANKTEAGECMHRIMLPEVLEKLNEALGITSNEKSVV